MSGSSAQPGCSPRASRRLPHLTDKDREAVANPAKFKGQKRAPRTRRPRLPDRMAAIFEECRRVLKPDGVMTVMFTHKASGAWDALAKGLVEAGFVITASWPINTEAEGSLHIKEKSAAKSTIFLVCRPREVQPPRTPTSSTGKMSSRRSSRQSERTVAEFQEAGIGGVDLYLACFGPGVAGVQRKLAAATRPRPQPEDRASMRSSTTRSWIPTPSGPRMPSMPRAAR